MLKIDVDDECPDFALPADDGTLVSEADLMGSPFVLYFYPKDDSSGCTQEAIDFTALAEEFAGIGVPVFGVSPDSVADHRKFRKKHDLGVRLLADEKKQLLEEFGVWVEKSMYGRKYMGVERTTALVDATGRIARIWPKVKVPNHAAEVLEAARRITEG